jgi:hypothetical protein
MIDATSSCEQIAEFLKALPQKKLLRLAELLRGEKVEKKEEPEEEEEEEPSADLDELLPTVTITIR